MSDTPRPSKEPFSWPTSKGDPIGPVWSYGGKKGMYQAEALRAFAHDLVDRIKEFELPVREAMKAAAGDGLNAFAYCRMLQRRLDGKEREIERLQRQVDELSIHSSKWVTRALELQQRASSEPPALRAIAERIRDHACAYGAPADSLLVKRELIGQLAQILGGSISEPPAVSLPDAVLNVAELLHTQDNRITANPLFAVEVKKRVYGIDPEWGGPVVWLHDGEEVTDADEIKQLEQGWENGDDDPDNHTRTSYHEYWEFVTACFTEEGCKAYLRSNGHNHRGEKRIYAHSGFRNREWEELRRYLMSLRSTPTKELAPLTNDVLCEKCGRRMGEHSADGPPFLRCPVEAAAAECMARVRQHYDTAANFARSVTQSAETAERPFNSAEAQAYGQFIEDAFEKPTGESTPPATFEQALDEFESGGGPLSGETSTSLTSAEEESLRERSDLMHKPAEF